MVEVKFESCIQNFLKNKIIKKWIKDSNILKWIKILK